MEKYHRMCLICTAINIFKKIFHLLIEHILCYFVKGVMWIQTVWGCCPKVECVVSWAVSYRLRRRLNNGHCEADTWVHANNNRNRNISLGFQWWWASEGLMDFKVGMQHCRFFPKLNERKHQPQLQCKFRASQTTSYHLVKAAIATKSTTPCL